MVIVVGAVVKCAPTTRNIPKEQRKYSNPNPKKSNDFYGGKEFGIWAISGNNNIEATTYSNSNQVIIRNLKLWKINSSFVKNYKKEYSLHLNKS